MANSILAYSSSPHVKNPKTTKSIMIDVCIALLPACVMGVVYFGLKALLILVLAVLSAVASEFIYQLICGKKFNQITKDFDFSSCVTGLLLGMVLGAQSPWYVPVLGSAFAIIVVKMLFGGTGKNLVNPAITGRIFVFMSFTAILTSGWVLPKIGLIGGGNAMVNPETGATILTNTFDAEYGHLLSVSNLDLFLGTGIVGCIGETCKLALLVGAIYLAIKGVINIIYPLIYVAVCGLTSVALAGFDFSWFLPSILSGGLILGAFFMATDYVTTPNTTLGNVIYFILLGLLTAGLRFATKIEVVSFVILLGNLVVPLIDKFIINKPFGALKKAKKKGA
ncbi:MAG: RnfABCDGE type electron transport complex subunit D [Clostridia bacterium]|jgi:RnfABCDGE-type electron transport complex D subunit|nr:RnfABCDGE type electron transport complex subunit D [Clostridia bacterium]